MCAGSHGAGWGSTNIQVPALCRNLGGQAAERNRSREQRPWHRDCSEGTHPIRCWCLLQAWTWAFSPPRGGGVLPTRVMTHVESLCHGHRSQGAGDGGQGDTVLPFSTALRPLRPMWGDADLPSAVPSQIPCSTSRTLTSPCTRLDASVRASGPADS